MKSTFFSVSNKCYTRNHPLQVVMDDHDRVACDDISVANANVEIHIKESNNLEKTNKCHKCDYSFSHAGDLRRHLKMHSGKKSNKCNQCDYASSWAGHLKRHLRTHRREKSNKCNQCDFASSYASALKRHLRTHSGEKSNKCNQCDYAFSQYR